MEISQKMSTTKFESIAAEFLVDSLRAGFGTRDTGSREPFILTTTTDDDFETKHTNPSKHTTRWTRVKGMSMLPIAYLYG